MDRGYVLVKGDPPAMHHDGTAYALYERAADALEADPVTNLTLATRGLELPLTHAADLLGFGLALDHRTSWIGSRSG